MIERRHRLSLWAAALGCAVLAVVVPISAGGSLTPLQWSLAAVAIVLFAVAPARRHVLVPAVGLVAADAMLALPDTEYPLFTLPIAGVLALAACDGMSVLTAWRSVGVLDATVEQAHLRAIGVRAGLGTAAAGAAMLFGLVELPSPTVTAVVGAAAAAAVLWLLTTRPTSG